MAEPLTILLTGATDGIGLELARWYAAHGERLVLVGRRPPTELEATLFTPERYCRVDLASADLGQLVIAFLRERGIERLDRVIHNAGLGWYGPVAHQSPASIDQLLTVNLSAPIALTHALLPALTAAGGRVIFIGSIAAALPVPDYAVYGATKAALAGFARSLRVELRGRVGVQVIHPGPTRTGMHARSGLPAERLGRRLAAPDRVAISIAQAIERGWPVVTIGAGPTLLRTAGRQLEPLVDWLVGWRYRSGDRGQSATLAAQRHCVITGGAAGIGRAVAERFAASGSRITLIDRDAAAAAALAAALAVDDQPPVEVIIADLADKQAIATVLDRLASLPPLDLVVHSAGISAVGAMAVQPLGPQLAVLDVNLRAPLLLTAGLLERGLLASRASVVFLASLSVFTGYPGAAVYAASKDGLAAYARSLRVGLAGRGWHVLTVYPGPTRTAHARRYSPDNRHEQRRMPPERLAAAIAIAVARRRATLIPGLGNRVVALIGRLAPGLTESVMRRTILARLSTESPAQRR